MDSVDSTGWESANAGNDMAAVVSAANGEDRFTSVAPISRCTSMHWREHPPTVRTASHQLHPHPAPAVFVPPRAASLL